jgi:DNA-binding winged helix-turn-helix (wHTH) protein/tetratricopeptide (TPR) repeat protein
MIAFPPFRLDQRAGRLWRSHQPVALRPKAWALLCYLIERPGVLVTKDDLHTALWADAVVSDDTLTRTLGELRQALGDDPRTPRIIETVHRRGFRFIGRRQESPDEAKPAASPLVPEGTAELEPVTLVGRDAELAKLGALFRQASAGKRQIVFIDGEPGIGKSAVVEGFLRTLRASKAPVQIGYGQCVEQHGEREPYMAVLEALERLNHGPDRDRLLPMLRSLAPSWLAQMPSLLKPSDMEWLRRGHADVTPHRMLREFAGLVEAIAKDRPLVLVLEDLHWSDQGTVDLVSVLAQRPERARLMLVATYRPAQAAALDHPIQQVLTLLRARGRCTDIVLEYLSRSDVATYLARRAPGARVADDVATVIHSRTDGNPLFMVVLVDHLLARSWLTQEGGAWRLTVSPATIEHDVPDNLRQLIEDQLRFVTPEERSLLEAASVAGMAFDAPAVAAGLGEAPERVESTCHHLCRGPRWLQHLGDREWPDGAFAARYAFRHALYQRALYDRVSPSRRRTLHERIGRRLETGYEGHTAEAASELARHFEGGRNPRRSLVYLEQAATRAYDRRAYRDVIGCLEPALRILGDLPDTPERARDELKLRRLYAVVLSQTAGYAADVLLDNLERTQGLCERLGDVAALFDALSGLCLLHAARGDLVQAEKDGDRLSQIADRLDPSAALEYHFLLGALEVWKGALTVGKALLARALSSPVAIEDADRPYGVNPVVAARSFEGLRRWTVGDRSGARAVQQEGLALAERHGRPFTLAQAATFGAIVSVLEEDWGEAAQLAGRAIKLSDEYGFPRWRGTALVIRGRAHVEQCDAARGLAEMHEGLRVLRLSGMQLGHSFLIALLAEAYLRMGRLDEGLGAADEGLTYCCDTTERLFESELWRLRGEIILRRACTGDQTQASEVQKAETCFQKARTIARAQGAHMLERRANRTGAGAAVRRAARA